MQKSRCAGVATFDEDVANLALVHRNDEARCLRRLPKYGLPLRPKKSPQWVAGGDK